ncbi:amidohydrolase [Idiomarina tyrosinivorans]|uniref:Amidohydrolase n=1 Tax=Idiomarina tyrosinivorans TaxID=1445662 RepID=A0A432ZSL8_9GAMM|nr:amidohydrolase [Idiomarina tyrosinivorans]RUO80873.1 amidohydrolase [Idiomarina tyrosinivorans]
MAKTPLRSLAFLAMFFIPWVNAQSLYKNVNGYTLTSPPGKDAVLNHFSEMVIADGKVLAIGHGELAKRFPDAKTIDLQGKTVLPGLTDAHGHVLGLGQNLRQVELREARSEAEAVQQVAQYATNNPNLRWVIGRGWNQELWPSKRFPSAEALDEVVNDRPVWLTRVDGHAGWANSKALKLAGINANTIDPDGGQIIRDSDGQPTGVLVDNAVNLMKKVLPEANASERQRALTAAFKHLLSVGITSTHDAGISQKLLRDYQQLAAEGKIPMRIYAMIAATDPALPEMLKQGPIYTKDDHFTARSVKIYADGALGSRGAALLKPYSDDKHQHGLMVTPVDEIRDLFHLIVPFGFQINIHAIGDRANRVALDAFAEVYQDLGGRNLRNRIEHAQVIAPADIPRFKALNIIASMQPTHATSDKNMAKDRLGEQRLKGAYAWQTLLEQGTIVAAGSDFPVELANPFYGLHAAVTRQSRDNQPQGGWRVDEALSLPQALRAFTLDAAYAAHQDEILGSLEPGKWADFIVVDRDPFAIPASDLWKVEVEQTFVGGKRVYSSTTP